MTPASASLPSSESTDGRRLLVDMEAPIDRHWCASDAFRTALLDALSMSFPVGEQFLIAEGMQAQEHGMRR